MCLEEEEVFCWLLVSVYRVAQEYWHIYIYIVYIYNMCTYIYVMYLGQDFKCQWQKWHFRGMRLSPVSRYKMTFVGCSVV